MLFTDRARGGACLVEGEPSPENSRLARYLAVRRREGEGELRAVADLTAELDEDPLAMATIDSPGAHRPRAGGHGGPRPARQPGGRAGAGRPRRPRAGPVPGGLPPGRRQGQGLRRLVRA